MVGKICVVTGATSGIGKAAALALARRQAVVVLICRDQAKGERVVREICDQVENATVKFIVSDLSSQNDIRELAAFLNAEYENIHVLLNNAGAMFPKRVESVDGIEMTLAVNHLAPFLLTNRLLDSLKTAGQGRVINVNSDAHEKGKIDFTDIQMRRRYPYGIGMQAYANAKLANLLTIYELARRLCGSNVTINAVHPGFVATNILPFKIAPGPVRLLKPLWEVSKRLILTPEQGAAALVFLACSPTVANTSGRYFDKGTQVASSNTSRDPSLQRRMWDTSEQLTRI